MMAVLASLYGAVVDVATTGATLANRDVSEMSEFYAYFGLTCGSIALDSVEAFRCNIVYGTPFDFERCFLKDRFFLSGGGRKERPFDFVIIDEVDSLFLDRLKDSCRLLTPDRSRAYEYAWVYREIYTACAEADPTPEEMLNVLRANELWPLMSETNRRTCETSCQRWITAAHAVKSLKSGGSYYVKQNSVLLVDAAHTGEIRKHSKLNRSRHQMLEAKHELAISDEQKHFGVISHLTFFNFYRRLSGLSGTLGQRSERSEIENTYNVLLFDVPVQRAGERLRLPTVVAPTWDAAKPLLVEAVLGPARLGRPVLVLLPSIGHVSGLAAAFPKDVRVQKLDGLNDDATETMVGLAGQVGVITLATNIGGRGMDIRPSPASQQNGGLHVIIGFFPMNERVQNQAEGRTARQGRSGSIQYVLSAASEKHTGPEEGDELFDLLYEQREKRTVALSEARQRSVGPMATILDSYTLRFADTHMTDESKAGLRDHFANWLAEVPEGAETPELYSAMLEESYSALEARLQLGGVDEAASLMARGHNIRATGDSSKAARAARSVLAHPFFLRAYQLDRENLPALYYAIETAPTKTERRALSLLMDSLSQRALRFAPKDHFLLLARFKALLNIGRSRDDAWQLVIKYCPYNSQSLHAVAAQHVAWGTGHRALGYARLAAQLQPSDAVIRRTLVACLQSAAERKIQAKAWSEAKPLLLEAARYPGTPNSAQCLKLLAKVSASLKKK